MLRIWYYKATLTTGALLIGWSERIRTSSRYFYHLIQSQATYQLVYTPIMVSNSTINWFQSLDLNQESRTFREWDFIVKLLWNKAYKSSVSILRFGASSVNGN